MRFEDLNQRPEARPACVVGLDSLQMVIYLNFLGHSCCRINLQRDIPVVPILLGRAHTVETVLLTPGHGIATPSRWIRSPASQLLGLDD